MRRIRYKDGTLKKSRRRKRRGELPESRLHEMIDILGEAEQAQDHESEVGHELKELAWAFVNQVGKLNALNDRNKRFLERHHHRLKSQTCDEGGRIGIPPDEVNVMIWDEGWRS